MRGRVVLVLHGLMRTRSSMNGMCRRLEQIPGLYVLNVSYPSTRASIADHAASLARIIENLDEVQEINFVAHSLGNLVIRHYLGDQSGLAAGKRPDPRLRRIVMLSPPNHGSRWAEAWGGNWLFGVLLGESGHQLSCDWRQLQRHLAYPTCEFAIVAGGKGDGQGWRADLTGDDDGTISVATARLRGAKDFAVVPVRHTFIMNDPQALEHTARFIEHGYFVSEEKRQPVLQDGEP